MYIISGLDRIPRPALALLTALTICFFEAAATGIKPGVVTTIAGDGTLGYQDGQALRASFMMPVAVAFDSKGRLYIVDEGAQRIRMLAGDRVSTVAGSGQIAGGIHVPGAYRDGPALQAKFNEPSGIAISPDGTIYIADELNHCIRMIRNETVTTYAGSPSRPGSSDGPIDSATFQSPRALALDDDGNLYIADYTVGIRKIDRSGSVTTIPMSPVGEKRFVGVAVHGGGDSVILFASSAEGRYYTYRPSIDGDAVHDDVEGSFVPHGFGVAAVNEDVFLATDVQANVIRLFRLDEVPYFAGIAAPVIAGVAFQDGTLGAGYRDGSLLSARFYTPLGIAVYNYQVVVADTGNRRIRAFPLVDVRRPAAGNIAEFAPDSSHYRIVFVGASHAFWATAWADSSPGLIESGLNAARKSLGIPQPVRMSVVRLGATGLSGQADYIDNTLMYGGANLVILGLTPSDLFTVPAPNGQQLTAAKEILQNLNASLRKVHSGLFVYLKPEVLDVSLVDDITDRLRDYSFHEDQGISTERLAETALAESGVPYYSAITDYLHYERQATVVPLWAYDDSHEDAAGRAFVANEILKALARMKPWSAPSR
jgi:sugar lactone lactonase YvrE